MTRVVNDIHLTYKSADELLVGDRIVNLGRVVTTRPDGAFVFVQLQDERWSPTVGLCAPVLIDRFFHASDELVIHS